MRFSLPVVVLGLAAFSTALPQPADFDALVAEAQTELNSRSVEGAVDTDALFEQAENYLHARKARKSPHIPFPQIVKY
jgi:hypothetical protein